MEGMSPSSLWISEDALCPGPTLDTLLRKFFKQQEKEQQWLKQSKIMLTGVRKALRSPNNLHEALQSLQAEYGRAKTSRT